MRKQIHLLLLAGAAGLAYCSFPAAFILNPHYALSGFASVLGESGQPFAWVFNALDYISGILALGLFAYLLAAYSNSSNLLRTAVISGLVNGLGILLAAIFSLPKNFQAKGLDPNLLSNPNIVLHALGSLMNSGGFFIGITLWGYYSYQQRKIQWRTAFAAVSFLLATIGFVLGQLFVAETGVLQRSFFVCYVVWIVVFTNDMLNLESHSRHSLKGTN